MSEVHLSFVRRAFAAIAVLSAALPEAAPSAAHVSPQTGFRSGPAVKYTIAPNFVGGRLTSVTVQMAFPSDADGRVILRLPDSFQNATDYWRLIDRIDVVGATFFPIGDGVLSLAAPPFRRITVSYRVKGMSQIPPYGTSDFWEYGPTISEDLFSAQGEHFIPTIDGLEARSAELQWIGWPPQWQQFSSADPIDATIPTMRSFRTSNFIAGPRLTLSQTSIEGGTVRLVFSGIPRQREQRVRKTIEGTLTTINDRLLLAGFPYTIVVQGTDESGAAEPIPTLSRYHGMSITHSTQDSTADLEHAIAEAHVRSWLPAQIGRLPSEPARVHWLAEGFTQYMTLTLLNETGVWSGKQVERRLNPILQTYYADPAKHQPYETISQNLKQDRALETHSWQRGFVFALVVDQILRAKRESSLPNVLLYMRSDADTGASEPPPDILSNFIMNANREGLDVEHLIDLYITRGIPMMLTEIPFDNCGAFE